MSVSEGPVICVPFCWRSVGVCVESSATHAHQRRLSRPRRGTAGCCRRHRCHRCHGCGYRGCRCCRCCCRCSTAFCAGSAAAGSATTHLRRLTPSARAGAPVRATRTALPSRLCGAGVRRARAPCRARGAAAITPRVAVLPQRGRRPSLRRSTPHLTLTRDGTTAHPHLNSPHLTSPPHHTSPPHLNSP